MTHPWNHSLTNIFSSPILLPQTYFNQRVCPFHIIPQISRPKWRKSQNHKTKPNGNIINAWSLTLTGCSMLSSNAKFPGQLHHSPKLPFQTLPALPRPPTLSPHSWKMIMALLHEEERVIQKLLYILCHKTYIFTCTSTILSLSLNINHLLPSAPKQTNKQTNTQPPSLKISLNALPILTISHYTPSMHTAPSKVTSGLQWALCSLALTQPAVGMVDPLGLSPWPPQKHTLWVFLPPHCCYFSSKDTDTEIQKHEDIREPFLTH